MKEQTRVVKCAAPVYKKGTNGKAVMIIHGYTGYPGPFYEMGELLHSVGYTINLVRLPGHGTNRRDYKKTSWRDWLNHARNVYMDLEVGHDSVLIIGHSMGGVLALILASRFNPEKVCLLAPGMSVPNRLFYMTPFLKFILPSISGEWVPEEGDDEDRRHLGCEYWSIRITRQVAGVYKLMRIARRGLGLVDSPLLLMLSELDETISSPKVEAIIAGGVKSPIEKVILKNSPHGFTEGPEKDFVHDEVIRWFSSPT
ncbi:MAG: alpha/beta fold hydrolase [Spirochaetales bacterium]|nr:alpha/beta fold hydrolase [Spirochaetales bacterium]